MGAKAPDDLIVLRSLIRFAKKERIHNFKYKEFEFNLAGIDPTEKRLAVIENKIELLEDIVNNLKLKFEFIGGGKRERGRR